MKSLRVDEAEKQIAVLNTYFRNRTLVGPSFYAQLEQAGFLCDRCVLVSFLPEGGTYSGSIVRQDGRVFTFDVDLDCSEVTEWNDVTDEFLKALKTGRLQPWAVGRLAYEAYLQMNGNQDAGG
jgi:hypothetical protein